MSTKTLTCWFHHTDNLNIPTFVVVCYAFGCVSELLTSAASVRWLYRLNYLGGGRGGRDLLNGVTRLPQTARLGGGEGRGRGRDREEQWINISKDFKVEWMVRTDDIGDDGNKKNRRMRTC